VDAERLAAAEPGVRLGEQRLHVLVVDDEPSLRRFAARVLEEAGYRVHQAADGLDALELVRVRGSLLDVVVSDVVMPRLNGVQLLERLSVSHPELPVLLMSGYATEQLAHRGITAPCAMLPKPFPPERLIEEVERCLKSRN
jgi:two-component system cell cycle sensor histidine kinase/response regulator CckA